MNAKIDLIDGEGPSAHHSFGFAFNSKQNFGYLHGGKANISEEQIALRNFWKWDDQKWNKIE